MKAILVLLIPFLASIQDSSSCHKSCYDDYARALIACSKDGNTSSHGECVNRAVDQKVACDKSCK